MSMQELIQSSLSHEGVSINHTLQVVYGPIRTHYTFVSTNEQFAPYEDDLAMVQRPSTITILYT